MDILRQNGAHAIWLNREKKVNQYLCFQSEFDVLSVEETTFYIAADTKYEFYINGEFAGFGQYEDYPEKKVYDEYDITALLKQGKNLLSVLAYSQGEDSFQHLSGLPMVIFAATTNNGCLIASGSHIKCREAKELISGGFERITPQRSFNFGFDLRFDDGWRTNLVSQNWADAVCCDDSHISYIPRPNKQLLLSDVVCGTILTQGYFDIREGETVSEKMQYAALAYAEKQSVLSFSENQLKLCGENIYWIADLGEEMAGYLVLDVEAEEGAVLDIACGEHLEDMRVRSYVGGRNFAFRCVCRQGRQKICFYIRRLAGRYLEFFAHKGIRVIHRAGLHKVEYPLDFISKFHSSDRLFNQIYTTSVRTLQLCMHEHYEDCPQREQALYGMDSRNQMLTGYYAFGETIMPRSSLELLAMSQREDGLFEICAPATYRQTIPSFALAWVLALKEYALFSGDLEFVSKMQQTARNVLDFFVFHMQNDVILREHHPKIWNFYEWTDGMDNLEDDASIKADAPINALFVMASDAYADLCGWIGQAEEQIWAKNMSDVVRDSFHTTFYNEDKCAYQSYIGDGINPCFSQLTQSFALLANCVPEELRKEVRKKSVSSELVATSLSYLIFQYDALMQEAEVYGDFVLNDIERQWGYMLYHGATSFWETILGEADFDRAGSLCHGWSAVPIYIFWRYVAGIYPEAPGKWVVEKGCCGENMRITGSLKTADGIKHVSKEGTKTSVTDLL